MGERDRETWGDREEEMNEQRNKGRKEETREERGRKNGMGERKGRKGICISKPTELHHLSFFWL